MFILQCRYNQLMVEHEVAILAISSFRNVVRFTVKDLSVIGRNTKGVKIQRLKYNEYLVQLIELLFQKMNQMKS